MTKKEIRQAGYQRGFCVASWTELPEIGAKVPKHIDWVGYEEVTKENAGDVFELYANGAESGSRQYADFSHLAAEMNSLAEMKPYDPWEVLEDGILAGIRANWRKRKSFYND